MCLNLNMKCFCILFSKDVIGFPPVLLRPVIEPDLPGAFLTLSPKEAYEQDQVVKIPYLATNTNEEAEFIRIGKRRIFLFACFRLAQNNNIHSIPRSIIGIFPFCILFLWAYDYWHLAWWMVHLPCCIVLKGLGFFRLWLRNWEKLAPIMLDYMRISPNTSAVTEAIQDFYFKGQDILKISGRELSRVWMKRYSSGSLMNPIEMDLFKLKWGGGIHKTCWLHTDLWHAMNVT